VLGGNLFVTDANNHTIRMVEIATGAVSTIAGKAGSPGGTDGIGLSARFDAPPTIATDGTSFYIGSNATVRVMK
jgi:hypothetical protein